MDFFTIAGFSKVAGCIDCTHIRIRGLSHHEHEFVNRKGYHSINVQQSGQEAFMTVGCLGSLQYADICKQFEKFEQCQACGRKAVIECEECYTILLFLGERHSRPVGCKIMVRPVLCNQCEQ